jgi:hypothetical protein
MDANNAKQPAASASTSSSSSSTPARSEPIKKFKLDPMSLLLPHERQMYAASNPAPPANYGQQQMPQGQIYQQGAGQRAQPGALGSFNTDSDMTLTIQQQTHSQYMPRPPHLLHTHPMPHLSTHHNQRHPAGHHMIKALNRPQ